MSNAHKVSRNKLLLVINTFIHKRPGPIIYYKLVFVDNLSTGHIKISDMRIVVYDIIRTFSRVIPIVLSASVNKKKSFESCFTNSVSGNLTEMYQVRRGKD